MRKIKPRPVQSAVGSGDGGRWSSATRFIRDRNLLDGRRALTLALAAGAIALMALGFNSLRPSQEGYLITKEQFVTGQPVSSADFTLVEANLGANPSGYLGASGFEGLAQQGAVFAARVLVPGSLVRASDFAGANASTTTSLSIPLAVRPATALRAGARVDLWGSPTQPNAESAILALAATILAIQSSGSSLGGHETFSAELLIEESEVAGVLSAMAESQQLAVVATSTR